MVTGDVPMQRQTATQQSVQTSGLGLVRYVLSSGNGAGQSRPAIVVKEEGDTASLVVFLDGANDAGADPSGQNNGMMWMGSVKRGSQSQRGTYY